MSAIGPGDAVQATFTHILGMIQAGQVYIVARCWGPGESSDTPAECTTCHQDLGGLTFTDPRTQGGLRGERNGPTIWGWCPCGFKPWKGPDLEAERFSVTTKTPSTAPA